ncbi:hypothetical protein PAXINDRAFT_90301, partial [Paxillus involutus ATCC 200175]
ITYDLTIYSISQMQKAEKQRKSVNTFLVLASDYEFDTIKAQILMKIAESLNPKMIAFEDYSISWTIPRTQVSSMPLRTPADYLFCLDLVVKQKTPSVNLIIEACVVKKKVNCKNFQDSQADSLDSDDDSQGGGDEKSNSKKSKPMVETKLNEKITAKIQLLKNCWMCSKPGCLMKHCFVHPEHSNHFSLGHKHFAVWAEAWNKDEQLTNLEKPPNHHKFNTLPGCQHGGEISTLLQRRLTERNQQAASNSGSVINFNIPPELFTMF